MGGWRSRFLLQGQRDTQHGQQLHQLLEVDEARVRFDLRDSRLADTDECAELGLNWLRVMKQRAREQRTARELDLVLSVDQPPAGSPMPFAPPTGGDDATMNHDANEADE